jgi:alpha-beta hydrolase superfamily lysophospholipase
VDAPAADEYDCIDVKPAVNATLNTLAGALLRPLLRLLGYGSAGVALTLLTFFVLYLEGRPDLQPWHTADLDLEFRAGTAVASFEEYLAREDRLFAQLEARVYDRTGPADGDLGNRYRRGSAADPGRWPRNWNRSFEFAAPGRPVLLLHGLSDSPYSMLALGKRLHAAGAHVVGLRSPGHGTAPSGLLSVRWQDMAAAVRLAVEYLAARHPGQPVNLIGYSNGGALAVQYALTTLDEPVLPRVGRLVLLSPEIGVTRAAALAVWQARLGLLLGLDKLAWNDILPEYDPFKYGSFAVNAGDLSYRITGAIQRHLSELAERDRLGAMPPILAFSSAVDATVLPLALVENLFERLPPGGHELVLYDINHRDGIQPLLNWSPDPMVAALQRRAGQSYALSVVTNAEPGGAAVIERRWVPGADAVAESALGLEWPADVYALSHIALPFAPDDPLYGGRPEVPSPGIRLGDLAWRGERGVLQVSPAAMLRQRWNPFWAYQERRILEFLELAGAPEASD